MSSLFKKNLAALKLYNPEASLVLQNFVDSPCQFATAKSGHRVPLVEMEGRPQPVHSLYDPVKEAENVMGLQDKPCLLILGFGGGFWPKAALQSPDRELVAVVDLQPGVTRAILENSDWTDVFQDPRFRMLTAPTALVSCYRPGLMGSLESLILPVLLRINPNLVKMTLSQCEKVLDEISSDQATQGRMGRRWMVNTWRNLDFITNIELELPKNRRIWVLGAGPSLEGQIRQLKQGDLILCADTALPCLHALGMEPDVVMTLDPQYYSLLHYLPGKPKGVILRELGTFPGLEVFSDRTLFFLSHNPLHLWLKNQGLDLPLLETRSGNVIGSLLQLAFGLEPSQVILAGVDMGYPQGQTYARETYQHHFHDLRSFRTNTLETAQATLLFQGKENIKNGTFQMSEGHRRYRERFKKLSFPGEIVQLPGKSPPLELSWKTGPLQQEILKNSKARVSFLKNKYYNELTSLPDPAAWTIWSSRISQEQQLFFESLGPLFSWYHFHGMERLEKNWPIILRELSEIIFTEGSTHGFEQ